jgi:hypothetical protein
VRENVDLQVNKKVRCADYLTPSQRNMKRTLLRETGRSVCVVYTLIDLDVNFIVKEAAKLHHATDTKEQYLK